MVHVIEPKETSNPFESTPLAITRSNYNTLYWALSGRVYSNKETVDIDVNEPIICMDINQYGTLAVAHGTSVSLFHNGVFFQKKNLVIGFIENVKFSFDGTRLVFGTRYGYQVWDIIKDKLLANITLPRHCFKYAFSLDGDIVYLLENSRVTRYNIVSEETREKRGPAGFNFIAVSPVNGTLVVGNGLQSTISFCNPETLDEIAPRLQVNDNYSLFHCEFSPNASHIWVSYRDESLNEGGIMLINIQRQEIIAYLEGPKLWIRSFCLSQDGRYISAISNDGTLTVWDFGDLYKNVFDIIRKMMNTDDLVDRIIRVLLSE